MRRAARVHRQRLGWFDTPTGLLSGLPSVDRLVALVGDWRQGTAVIYCNDNYGIWDGDASLSAQAGG